MMHGVFKDYQATEAVSLEEQGYPRLPLSYLVEKSVEVFSVLAPRAQVGPLAGRPAIAPHIETAERQIPSRDFAYKVGIETAVVAQSMQVHQDRTGRSVVGQPALIEKPDVPKPLKRSFNVSHRDPRCAS